MRLASLFVGLLVVTTTLPAGAGERIIMRVSPAVAFAPANLIVRASIEADSQNRSIEISAESNDFYRSSEISLDGDKAPRTNIFEFRNLPPGSYAVRATLLDARGKSLAHAQQSVNVLASGSDPGR